MDFFENLVDFLKKNKKSFIIYFIWKDLNFFKNLIDIFDIEYYLIITLNSLIGLILTLTLTLTTNSFIRYFNSSSQYYIFINLIKSQIFVCE